MILEEFRRKDIAHFHEDMSMLMELTMEMDSDYGGHSDHFTKNQPVFEAFCKRFTEKYRTLLLVPKFTRDDCTLRIYLNERSLLRLFDGVISRIEGLSGAGGSPDDMIESKGLSRLRNEVLQLGERAFFLFGKRMIMLRYSSKRNIWRLIYNVRHIMNETSPEYKLCAYFALSGGFERTIELDTRGFTFSAEARGIGSQWPRK